MGNRHCSHADEKPSPWEGEQEKPCLSKGNEIPKHLVQRNKHQARHSVKVAKQRLILFYATGMKAV